MNYSKYNKQEITQGLILFNLITDIARLEEEDKVIDSVYYFSNMTKQRGEESHYKAKGICEVLEKFYYDINHNDKVEVACIGVHYRYFRPGTGMEVKASEDLAFWEVSLTV